MSVRIKLELVEVDRETKDGGSSYHRIKETLELFFAKWEIVLPGNEMGGIGLERLSAS